MPKYSRTSPVIGSAGGAGRAPPPPRGCPRPGGRGARTLAPRARSGGGTGRRSGSPRPGGRPHGVDRHRRFHPEPRGERTAARAAAVSARCPDNGSDARNPVVADRPLGRPLHEPEPAAGERREHRDRHVGPAGPHGVHEGAETRRGPLEIGVREQPDAGGGAGRAPPRPRDLPRGATPAGPWRRRPAPPSSSRPPSRRPRPPPRPRTPRAPRPSTRRAGPRPAAATSATTPAHQRRQDSGGSAPGTTIIASSASP